MQPTTTTTQDRGQCNVGGMLDGLEETMASVREIMLPEKSLSLREVTTRYGVDSLRVLFAAYSNRRELTYLGYRVSRTASALTVTSADNPEVTTVGAPAQLSNEQKEHFAKQTWEGTKKYLQENWDGIKKGEIKAADIGGAVNGIAAAVIVESFGIKKDGLVSQVLVGLAEEKGRFVGAAVDSIVAAIKGEDGGVIKSTVGLLAATTIASKIPVVAAFGDDAWKMLYSVSLDMGGRVEEWANGIVGTLGGILDQADKLLPWNW
jgi:hypothetical protein